MGVGTGFGIGLIFGDSVMSGVDGCFFSGGATGACGPLSGPALALDKLAGGFLGDELGMVLGVVGC